MKLRNILIFALAAVSSASCEHDKYMDFEGGDLIYFASKKADMYLSSTSFHSRALGDSSKSYTFYYDDESVREAEIVFDLYATGGPKDYDRPFVLEQIVDDGVDNAVPGVNYKAFDSEEMKQVYVMKSGETHLRLPIAIKRSNDTEVYTLRFQLVANEYFKPGQSDYIWRKAVFTSALQQPDGWTEIRATNYFGKYSRTKHEWMIQETGFRWDNDFVDQLIIESDARGYWMGQLKAKLTEINKERSEAGLGPWEDEDGEVIALGRYA